MPQIVFIQPDGTQKETDAVNGDSLMITAVNAGITGILADCGGTLTCATCHCFIEEQWQDLTGEPDEFEDGMLNFTTTPRQEGSRLSCQVTITDELDGMVIRIPESQT